MLFKKFLKLISEAVCALFFMKLKRLRTIYQHFVILQLPNQRIDFPVMQLIFPRITQITLRYAFCLSLANKYIFANGRIRRNRDTVCYFD